MSEPCPPLERWQEHLDGTLSVDEQAVLTEHLNGCADCRKTLETLAGGSDSLLDVARQAGAATDASTPALHDVLAKCQVPPSETQAEPKGARDDSLSFLTASEKPGCLGRLGHYEVQEVIGKGGFGIVLKAFDEKLHRVVAIKVLSPAYAAIGSARKRFIREAQSAAAVKNEHVVAIYSVQDEAQPPYLVMELIDGISLQEKLYQKGSLSLKEILRIGLQTAEGLAAAHKQGLVHRDIKPANILLENGVERVRITDFGLARAVDDASMTQSGTIAGTPMYMSPEQAEGLPIDHRSDLFSLGTVLYAMCIGHPPFRASGTHAVLKRVIDAAPRPIREINSEIPDWLCAIIAKLHAKKLEERFQTAKEVAELLGQHLAHIQQPSQTPRPAPTAVPTAIVPRPADTAKSQPMSASIPAAPRRPLRMAVIVLAIAAVVMVSCMIPVGIVLYVLSSSSAPNRNPGVAPQPDHNLNLIRDDPTISLFVNPEDGGQNGFIFDGLEFGTVLPPGRYQVQGKKNGVLVFQQWVILDANLKTTVHVRSGWVQLFNGKDLTGWKLFPADKDVWRVKDGVLIGQGAECSMLPSERSDFRDFHLRVEAMINEGGDSGVWFRTDLKSQDGYEANINHSHRDLARTGSLGIKMNHKQKWLHHQNDSPAPANTWFTLEVVAAGPNVTVKVDGVTVAQVTDANRSAGHIGLEMFEKGSVAHFRKIEIKELPPEPTEWVQLFNGKDLTGWRTKENDKWKVENGVLIGSAPGHLFANQTYQDFHCRIKARYNADTSGSLAFRGVADKKGEALAHGEVEIGNRLPGKTGSAHLWYKPKPEGISIWDRELVPPDTWFELELIVRGKNVVATVNGTKTADITLDRLPERGRISLNAYGPGTVLKFKKIEIKELPPEPTEWVQLFNGKDLSGWHQPLGKGDWKVIGNVLTGSAKAGEHGILPTLREYGSFHFRTQVRLTGPGNSGIVFRTDDGYEVEIDARTTGSIARSRPFAWLEIKQHTLVKPGSWCDLELIADGPKLTTKVNGQVVASVTDGSVARGYVALQLDCRGQGAVVVEFRKIEIKELLPKD
jgi:serine/threonine protein kinase